MSDPDKEIERHLARLEVEGFCVIEEVIPAAEVGAVRDAVLAAVESVAEETLAKAAAVRAQGHRLNALGVQAVPGLLNLDQSAAPWLAEPRIMAIAGALFGDWVRLSNTAGLVNYPGNDRAYWHADWPYNQTNAAHIPAPYPDEVLKLSSLWMLSEFSPRTGGTLVVPGSHRARNNPSGGDGVFDREQPHPSELQISGGPGSVMLFDSRLWHCVARNLSDEPRVAMNVGYLPWWLSIEPTREGSPDFVRMVVETEGKPNITPGVRPEVYERLPEEVKPLVRHLVA